MNKIKTDHILDDANVDHNKQEKKLRDLLKKSNSALKLNKNNLHKEKVKFSCLQDKYLCLYEMTINGYFTLNKNNLIIEVNESGANLLGVEKSGMINQSFLRYIDSEFQYVFSHQFNQIIDGAVVKKFVLKLHKRPNTFIYAEVEGKNIINPETQEKEILLIVSKIDSQYATTVHSNAFNSLNELTMTMTNELNQPISIITNYVNGSIHALKNGSMENEKILTAMYNVSKQLQCANDVIMRLKNFVSKPKLKFEATCIDQVIQVAVTQIKDEMNEYDFSIKYLSAALPALVMIDKTHMQQVVLHILRNAVEAMRDVQTHDPKIIIEASGHTLNAIEISIFNNGPSLASQTAESLFDPYYSNKSYGIGTGLSYCRSVIEAHGGTLKCDNNRSYGACFILTLPLTQK